MRKTFFVNKISSGADLGLDSRISNEILSTFFCFRAISIRQKGLSSGEPDIDLEIRYMSLFSDLKVSCPRSETCTGPVKLIYRSLKSLFLLIGISNLKRIVLIQNEVLSFVPATLKASLQSVINEKKARSVVSPCLGITL